MSDLGSRVFLTGVIISCTMAEHFPPVEHPVPGVTNALNNTYRNYRSVSNQLAADRNFMHARREELAELLQIPEALSADELNYVGELYSRIYDTGKAINRKERERRYLYYRFLRLREAKRRNAYRRLRFMHRSGRAPWRAARR